MSERTSLKYVYYALKLYSSGLSLRRTSQHLSLIVKRNHVSVWNWIQKYKPKKIFQKRNKIQEFIVDETLIKVSNDYVWVWIAIEPIDKVILDIRISFERTMLVAEQFLKGLVKKYGKHSISSDGATWYPQACKFLKITHHIHSYYEKSIVERTIQYLKDRTECFDDYFPCRKYNCKLEHVIKWLGLFADMYNKMILR
jgi:putative transposase